MTITIDNPAFESRMKLMGTPPVGQLLWHLDFNRQMTPVIVIATNDKQCDLLCEDQILTDITVAHLTFYWLP